MFFPIRRQAVSIKSTLSYSIERDVFYDTDHGFQNQSFALWRSIATRYKDSKTVAGDFIFRNIADGSAAYDLLDQPEYHQYSPRLDIVQNYTERLIGEIREVDTNHFLILVGVEFYSISNKDSRNLYSKVLIMAPTSKCMQTVGFLIWKTILLMDTT